ncbi:Integrin alpha-D [Phytophthora palmivora]|uniref:Integrin alpha-D n=1 Tax=Phytophthora palmivora TaxID=4796 RepID=A0A2P4XBN9_9STRA|nr:Integrin alpha-D [Phytophthora palmivora]
MPRRPKNKNKTKLQARIRAPAFVAVNRLAAAESATTVAKSLGVHPNSPNKCYVEPSSRASLAIRHPALEKRVFAIDDVEVLSAALTQPVTACEPHVYPPILKTKPFDYQEDNS